MKTLAKLGFVAIVVIGFSSCSKDSWDDIRCDEIQCDENIEFIDGFDIDFSCGDKDSIPH